MGIHSAPLPTPHDAATNIAAGREKRLVALSSVAAAVFLTAMKLTVGLMTGSLGILAEAAHSALDLVAAGITFFAVRVSDRPADREHTYGHGKVENLSALFETALLFGTCAWIIYEAVQRLFFEHVEVQSSWWAFVVMGVSIVVDISRSRALMRAARKYKSQALEADALHFSTDVYSSAVVILGLGLVAMADRLGLPWLAKGDAGAALVVAGIVIYISAQLGRRTVAGLLDAVPGETRDRVRQAVGAVPGVLHVERVRLRQSGPDAFADLTVQVERAEALEDAHAIASNAEAAVHTILPDADVVVHVEPVRSSDESLTTSTRLLAAQLGLGAHSIRTFETVGGPENRRGVGVELHLEVSDRLSVDEAHRQVTAFEEALRRARPEVREVVTHIEPVGDGAATTGQCVCDAEADRVRGALLDWQAEEGGSCQPHAVTVRRIGDELAVALHCEMAGDTPLADAHILSEQAEQALRRRLPDVGRVVIHIEPEEGAGEAGSTE
jgi:cation diffusion facilitator family transporter